MLKDNYNESIDRYKAFWAHEKIDRAIVLTDMYGKLQHPMYNGSGYNYQKYDEDIERFCDDFVDIWKKRASIADDSIPCISPQHGGAIEPAFWGGEIQWGTEVASLKPYHPYEGIKDYSTINFDPDNKYYSRLIREIKQLSEMADGRYGVNFDASNSITTTIAFLVGESYMMDLFDKPGDVSSLANKICNLLIDIQTTANDIIPHPDGGTCQRWLNYWVPGSGLWFSEDDAIMLSPEMYNEFFLELNTKLCNACDYPVVHWHTGAIHLIDELLKIDKLKMVQLSFDPNGPDLETVIDACKRIEKAGKKICFQETFNEHQLKDVFKNIDYNSCMFYCGGLETVEAANDNVKLIEKLSGY